MTVNDWPGRGQAEASRQWPVLEVLARDAAGIDGIDGLILLGSFAAGDPDELSDVDALAVVAEGRLAEVWRERDRLVRAALVTWESCAAPESGIRWLKWLTRDLVKVECGFVDPARSSRGLAEPIVVFAGDASIADRFPRISTDDLDARRRQQADQPIPDDPNEVPYGELIDWKLAELKNAVRRGIRDGDA